MDNQHLCINSVYEWKSGGSPSRQIRLLWIDPGMDLASTIDINNPKAKLRYFDCELLQNELDACMLATIPDPWAHLENPSGAFTPAQITVRDTRRAAMRILLDSPTEDQFHRSSRHKLISTISSRPKDDPTRLSKKYAYTLLRLFWQRGQTENAFIPDYGNCGWFTEQRRAKPSLKRLGANRIGNTHAEKRAGYILKPEDYPKLEMIGRLYHTRDPESKKLRSWSEAHDLGCRKFYRLGWTTKNGVRVELMPLKSDMPSIRQLKSAVREREHADRILRARVGERAYNLKHRPINGDQRSLAFGPMQLVQIDAQVAKIYLVHRITRQLVGRPTVVLAHCTFTRMIVGVAVTYEHESWTAYRLAIINTAMNKVDYCASLGIPIEEWEWPSHGMPGRWLADNGPMISQFSDDFQAAFKVTIFDAASGRPDMKPVVENGFQELNTRLVFSLPGAILIESEDPDGDPQTRKYMDNACLDIEEFERLVVAHCLDHNKRVLDNYPMSDDMLGQVDPIPVALWKWGVDNRTGEPRIVSVDRVRAHCLSHATARVTERGICFEDRYYECTRSLEHDWQSLARNRGEWWVDIVYDPNNLREIYLWRRIKDGHDSAIEPCWRKAADGESFDISLAERRGVRVQCKVRVRELRESDPQRSADFAATIRATVDDAKAKTAQALGGRKQLRDNLRQRHTSAIQEERSQRSEFPLPAQEPSLSTTILTPSDEDVPADADEDFSAILSTLEGNTSDRKV